MRKSILLVEDEPFIVLALEEMLLEQGCLVQIAHDGAQALNALESGMQFDVLVTDIRLPHANGWAIARHARDIRPNLPVIYMSGDSAAEHAANGVAGSTMLSKPFGLEHFVELVAAAAPVAQ